MKTASVLVALASVAVLLAGCGAAPAAPKSSGVGPELTLEEGSTLGALAGVVVDETIRPLAGATVTLVDGSANRTTDEGGLFAFEDLEPGTYFLSVNATLYGSVQTSAEVRAGEVTRIRILLSSTGGLMPYHETIHFKGFIEASGGVTGSILNIIVDEFGDNPLCSCSLEFNTTGLDVRTIVVEAVWEDTVGDPRGPSDMYLEVYPQDLDDSTDDIQGGFLFSPILEHYPIGLWGENETNVQWHARLTGSADHVNYQQSYDLFVTLFVNAEAPDGWSLAAGDV